MSWIIWLAAFVVLIGIEAVTMGLTTIWFAGGALVSFFLSLLGAGPYLQFAVFFAVSCALLFFTRPFALRFINKNTEKTNVEGLAGKKARVTERIDNDEAQGTAVVAGQEWTARAGDGKPIEAGCMVRIEAVSGVKLIVRKIEEEG